MIVDCLTTVALILVVLGIGATVWSIIDRRRLHRQRRREIEARAAAIVRTALITSIVRHEGSPEVVEAAARRFMARLRDIAQDPTSGRHDPGVHPHGGRCGDCLPPEVVERLRAPIIDASGRPLDEHGRPRHPNGAPALDDLGHPLDDQGRRLDDRRRASGPRRPPLAY